MEVVDIPDVGQIDGQTVENRTETPDSRLFRISGLIWAVGERICLISDTANDGQWSRRGQRGNCPAT